MWGLEVGRHTGVEGAASPLLAVRSSCQVAVTRATRAGASGTWSLGVTGTCNFRSQVSGAAVSPYWAGEVSVLGCSVKG